MKRVFGWRLGLAIFLIALSGLLYFAHYSLFHDSHHIFIYLVGDVAFVPIEVLIVVLILERLLHEQEKRSRLKKLNMVIGAFFSEVGTELLRQVSAFDAGIEDTRARLAAPGEGGGAGIRRLKQEFSRRGYDIDIESGALPALKTFLVGKRCFLLGLLENPNLLEHESFTEQLWAVFHLTEELEQRRDFAGLPASDLEHLAGDIKRAYSCLVAEWISYMAHLKKDYPYLYSLAVRTNPFNAAATVIVGG